MVYGSDQETCRDQSQHRDYQSSERENEESGDDEKGEALYGRGATGVPAAVLPDAQGEGQGVSAAVQSDAQKESARPRQVEFRRPAGSGSLDLQHRGSDAFSGGKDVTDAREDHQWGTSIHHVRETFSKCESGQSAFFGRVTAFSLPFAVN